MFISSSLSASANNDVLVGIDINPSFDTGSFTGVSRYALRTSGDIQLNNNIGLFAAKTSGGSFLIAKIDTTDTVVFGNNQAASQCNGATLEFRTAAVGAKLFATNNLVLQNGGTFTDAGYRLDVSGSARITNGLTLTGSIATPLIIARDGGSNSNIQFRTNNDSMYAGSRSSSFGIGPTQDLQTTSQLTIFGSTGNVVVQNGGTPADTGYRLDVIGSARVKGAGTTSATTALTIQNANASSSLVVLDNGSVYSNGPGFVTSNTAFGFQAALSNTTATGITAIGYQALYVNTTGSANTAVGANALQNSTAGNNTAIGYQTLRVNVTGEANTAVGQSALINNTVSANTAVGYQAGFTNTTGLNITAIGYRALRLSTADNNTALGFNAGTATTTGTGNTFIGATAGQNNTTGSNNTFVGQNSGAVSVASFNTALGTFTMDATTTGQNNTSIGYAALRGNTTGGNNVTSGTNAGRFIADGTTAATIVNNSILIGSSTRVLADSQTNQIVIGYNATGLGSNTTILGNSSTTFTSIPAGGLGVNTTSSAGYTLNISGSGNFTNNLTVTGSLILSGSNVSTAWTSYTPDWTTDGTQPALNNGALTGAYKVIGKTCFVRVKLNPGSTSTFGSGAFQFSLPFSASSADGIQFPCSILNNGLAWYQGTVNGTYSGATNKSAIIAQSAGGVNSSEAVTATHPFTFGTSDSIQFNGSYEIA
jgi:hypothetical protein